MFSGYSHHRPLEIGYFAADKRQREATADQLDTEGALRPQNRCS